MEAAQRCKMREAVSCSMTDRTRMAAEEAVVGRYTGMGQVAVHHRTRKDGTESLDEVEEVVVVVASTL